MRTRVKSIYQLILGGIIVVCFFACVYLLITVEMPNANENMLYILLGVLAAKFSDVVGYFYGSSAGSASKDETIYNLKNGNNGNP